MLRAIIFPASHESIGPLRSLSSPRRLARQLPLSGGRGDPEDSGRIPPRRRRVQEPGPGGPAGCCDGQAAGSGKATLGLCGGRSPVLRRVPVGTTRVIERKPVQGPGQQRQQREGDPDDRRVRGGDDQRASAPLLPLENQVLVPEGAREVGVSWDFRHGNRGVAGKEDRDSAQRSPLWSRIIAFQFPYTESVRSFGRRPGRFARAGRPPAARRPARP